MTTRVKVTLEQLHDGKRCRAQLRSLNDEAVHEESNLDQNGQEVAFYVHDGAKLVVEEVDG